MRFVRQSEYIKYNDEYNDLHQLFVDALDTPNFRKYILAKASPIWGPSWDRTNEKLVRDEQEAE